MLEALKKNILDANLMLHRSGLAPQTWGNVSGIDRERGVFGIKPSGVPYNALTTDKIVLLDLDGQIVEGDLRPSSDTPTHLELYRTFEGIGGITHTHSPAATAFAQAGREVPCLGTTHADHFDGAVPIARMIREDEVMEDYEKNTGTVIVERFSGPGAPDPMRMPAVLVPGHGPFTWGADAEASVTNGIVLEIVCTMARDTFLLKREQPIPAYLLRKHFDRKHGPAAYYGQKE